MGGQDAGHRRGVQQVARAPGQHAGQQRPHGVDVGHHVDPPLLVPHRGRHRQDVAAGPHAGVVEADVDRAQPVLDLLHHGVDGGLIGDVAADADGPSPALAGHVVGTILVDVDDRHPGAGRRERSGRGRSDAAGSPGDDGDPLLHVHGGDGKRS